MYGGIVGEALAERLIASVRGREDELPLLQHGLMLMWDEAVARAAPGKPPELDGAMVEKAGSLAALLSNHADTVMESVAPDERRKTIVERIFCELTDVNAEGSAIRRPRPFSEVCACRGRERGRIAPDPGCVPRAGRVVPDALRACSGFRCDRIDISHEALIRCWRRIATGEDGWLKEVDDGLAWRSLLTEARAFERDTSRVSRPRRERSRRSLCRHNQA